MFFSVFRASASVIPHRSAGSYVFMHSDGLAGRDAIAIGTSGH